MTPGQLRYAEMVVIRLSVEMVTGMPHADDTGRRRWGPYRTAARQLGAHGRDSHELLSDLVAILSMYGYEPTRTVRHALAA